MLTAFLTDFWKCGSAERIDTSKSQLLHLHRDVLADGEAVPLVVDHEDAALHGVARLVAHLAELVGVHSPLEVHGVLGLDSILVLVGEGCPLAVDLYLGTRNIEDHTMIVARSEIQCFSLLHRQQLFRGHQVLHEEPGRIDELERLCLSVESDIVSKTGRSNHF